MIIHTNIAFPIMSAYISLNTKYLPAECLVILGLACVAGLQRGGRGEVECEREARRERDESAIVGRS